MGISLKKSMLFKLQDAISMAILTTTTAKLQSDSNKRYVINNNIDLSLEVLLYVIAIRPDISFNAGCCARFQADPKERLIKDVKRTVRYVKGIIGYVLSYSMDTNSSLIDYSDACNHFTRSFEKTFNDQPMVQVLSLNI